MLRQLDISNYAVIRSLSMNFESGLNIITGQTGAGKSILLGALGLLSGSKAEASILLDSKQNCVVEGIFDIGDYGLKPFFSGQEVEYNEQITIRRVIAPTGKSRAFVDDQPVTQGFLKDLGEKLIDIHSQHQSMLLSHSDFQTKIVDSIAKQLPLIGQYQTLYNSLKIKQKEYTQMKTDLETLSAQRTYLESQSEQIEVLKLKDGELEALENELSMLTHADDIAQALAASYNMADDADTGYLVAIHRTLQQINAVKKHYEPLAELYDRLNSSYLNMKDISDECYSLGQKLELNPARRESIEQRIDAINGLMHRNGAATFAELMAIKTKIDEQLWELTQGDMRLQEAAKAIFEIEQQTKTLADRITQGRRDTIPKIEHHTVRIMKDLGINDARLVVSLTTGELGIAGQDEVRFLFSANAVSDVQPIEKVASGGEISRLMLALKGLVSHSVKLPTIIFDEIDTGVSGAIADKMGEIISIMGSSMQVINITHLPQVASKGDHHFYVYKDKETHIIKLTTEQRIEKIAEMLSGANITDAAREQARALLTVAGK